MAEVAELSQAGYVTDPAEITEKVGYEVALKAAPEPTPENDPATPPKPLANRRLAKLLANAARVAALSADRATLKVINAGRAALAQGMQQEMKPLRDRLTALEGITNDAAWRIAAQQLVTDLRAPTSALRASLGDVTASAQALADSMSAALVNGVAAGSPKPKSP